MGDHPPADLSCHRRWISAERVQIVAYIASRDCVACEVEQGIAILDLQSNTYFSLDPVGASVWQAMGTPISLDELAEGIAAEYAVAPETCRGDIADLLDDMMKHGLVQTV